MNDYFLADDLSGALDAAAAFQQVGGRVTIAWRVEGWAPAKGGVVGYTTETRNAAPEIAAAAVARAVRHGRALGARLVFKKIDSTLRGPVAAELAALAAEMPEARILFAPANPRVGRTVRGGVLLVRGVPVAETEFGRDPVSPVRESDIRRLLGDAETNRVVIADAATEADLAAAVARMDGEGGPWIGVGSGALARPIARRRSTEPAPRASAEAGTRLSAGPCVMVCGSAHQANREQAARLSIARGVPVVELRLGDAAGAIDAALRGLQRHGGVSLLIEERRADRAAVLSCVATAAATVLRGAATRRVFVTGGETAFALAGKLAVPELAFDAEIESGLSLSHGMAADGPVRFAIKPGGFGDAETWVRAWDALAAE